jgi:hypothetical protein
VKPAYTTHITSFRFIALEEMGSSSSFYYIVLSANQIEKQN